MRCKITHKPLPAIWRHPDLEGQWVAALTRKNAWALTKAITGKDLPVEGFSRTGGFAWRERIISQPETLFEVMVKSEDMNK